MSNNIDHTFIKNMEDLQAMQVMVKLRILEREKDLGKRIKLLPKETVKAATAAVVPSFLASKISGSGMGLVTSAMGLLFNRKSSSKKDMVSSAKKLGVFSLLKAGYSLWRKK